MQDSTTRRLRNTAAAVTVAAGAGLIASLWLRPLGQEALLDAALGAAYLILGIGLWGRSRLSLWLGVVLPGLSIAATLHLQGPPGEWLRWRLAADAAIILSCLLALWSAGRRST